MPSRPLSVRLTDKEGESDWCYSLRSRRDERRPGCVVSEGALPRGHGRGQREVVGRAVPRPTWRSAGARTCTTWPRGSPPAGSTGSTDGTWGRKPGGPGPHFHRTMSESFFVLAGAVGLYDGERWVNAAPGDFLFVPAGRDPRVRQPRGARLDADPVCPRRPARGLLRGTGGDRGEAAGSSAGRSGPTSTAATTST